MAANTGEYSQADPHLSSAFKKSSLVAKGGSTKALWDKLTRDGTVQRIEILDEIIRDEDWADVKFRLHFKDDKTKYSQAVLAQENGKWKFHAP